MLACVALLSTTLRFSYDLGLFLPEPTTAAQRVLVERLGAAPGARLILVALSGADDDAVDEAINALADTGLFTRVLAGPPSPGVDDIPDVVWSNRYLLRDAPLDAQMLAAALADRTADLALFAGGDFNRLLRGDPTMASLAALERLATNTGDADRWRTDDGTPVLLIETAAPAFDLAAQATAVDELRRTLDEAGLDAVPSGPGVFGVELRDTIHAEARNRSMLASLGLAIVLFVAYRRWPVLVLAALPLASGALAGLTAVALAFPAVHGITLAFGFTLLGIAIDYPLHLFSHARSTDATAAMQRIWPTLRLGAASTLVAYIAIALSGSQGAAQLGVFTAVGLLVAALVTRWILPAFVTASRPAVSSSARPARLRWTAVIVLLVAGSGLLVLAPHELWNNRLSDLSPVPPERLAQDNRFRQAVGTPSLRHIITLRDRDLQAVLQATEALDAELASARDAGSLRNWQTVTRLLPSAARFEARRARLPDDTALRVALRTALDGTPFAERAFDEFVGDVASSRSLPPLTVESFGGSALEPYVAAHLYQGSGEWVSVVSLFDVADPAALSAWLATQPGRPALVDFQAASQALVADYRGDTLRSLAIALAIILALLLWRLPVARALWSLSTVVAVVLTTAGLLLVLIGALNLYHLMALLLVAGLGLDYALFLSRSDDEGAHRADSRHAVLACGASTAVAFGVLAGSSIPALNALGTTVAIGTLISLAAAWWGAPGNLPD